MSEDHPIRKCPTCGEISDAKPQTGAHRDYRCKKCNRERIKVRRLLRPGVDKRWRDANKVEQNHKRRLRYQRNRERELAAQKKRIQANREKRRAWENQHRKTHRARYQEQRKKYAREHPERRQQEKAHAAVGRAIRRGILRRPPCEVCGDPRSEGHHHLGYEKEHWLHVRWLCSEHHKAAHAKPTSQLPAGSEDGSEAS